MSCDNLVCSSQSLRRSCGSGGSATPGSAAHCRNLKRNLLRHLVEVLGPFRNHRPGPPGSLRVMHKPRRRVLCPPGHQRVDPAIQRPDHHRHGRVGAALPLRRPVQPVEPAPQPRQAPRDPLGQRDPALLDGGVEWLVPVGRPRPKDPPIGFAVYKQRASGVLDPRPRDRERRRRRHLAERRRPDQREDGKRRHHSGRPEQLGRQLGGAARRERPIDVHLCPAHPLGHKRPERARVKRVNVRRHLDRTIGCHPGVPQNKARDGEAGLQPHHVAVANRLPQIAERRPLLIPQILAPARLELDHHQRPVGQPAERVDA
eukprot:m.221518 g.221518  ORF g.221518 m.221518 type:complete len:316 (-) comp25803_c0_seq9:2422-3369(-)